jgi:hypothetical protein
MINLNSRFDRLKAPSRFDKPFGPELKADRLNGPEKSTDPSYLATSVLVWQRRGGFRG